MNCATHSDAAAVAFCRSCGKALCASCTRDVRGVIYCEACLAARMEGAVPAPGFVPPPTAYPPAALPSASYPAAIVPRPTPSSGPNPAVAGILAGFFPFGVGAVYCSQYAKGFAHLLIFGLLIFGVSHSEAWAPLFGFSIAFFVVYQIIDAVRTARALQNGEPAPDPLGLGQAFGGGDKLEVSKVPVGAVVLIGLGVLFLLHTMGFWEFGLDRFWPLILIFLGAWIFARQRGMAGSTRLGCQCDRCRMRKLMGPAMLMTIGILFLLQNLDVASFDRTWPAILLVVGVVKLLQSNASSAGHIDRMNPGTPSGVPPQTPPQVPPSQVPPAAQPPSSGEVSNV